MSVSCPVFPHGVFRLYFDKFRERLEQHMQTLCAAIGERHSGSEGEKLAARYIEGVLKEIG